MTGPGRFLRPGVLFAVLIGAAAALVGVSGRTWAEGATTADPVTGLAVHTALAGTEVAPAVRPVALAVLAGSGALLLVRGRARTVLAVVLALLGLAASVLAIRAALDSRATVWSWVATVLALLCTLAAAAVALRSRTWSASSSRRYEASRGADSSGEKDPWTALDRGEDPTL